MKLEGNCFEISELFENLSKTQNQKDKEKLISDFKNHSNKTLVNDLDFCFEILDGKHKLNYTYQATLNMGTPTYEYSNYTICDFFNNVLKPLSNTKDDIELASVATPLHCRIFIEKLVNRKWDLDYTPNKNNKTNPLNKKTIMGAIIGDIAGSRFEFYPHKSKDFELLVMSENYLSPKQTFKEFNNTCRFTDDTVMTIAIANALIESNGNYSNLSKLAIKNMKTFGKKYPFAGYGNNFNRWLNLPNAEPYNSFGNGSATRISPIPYFAKSLKDVKDLTKTVTNITHNHPEGLKGAEVVACCIWYALNGYNKDYIKAFVENYYDLNFNYDTLLKSYVHDESCQNSVPQSIYAFLISNSYEDAIRTAISMGGDADTMACIAGSIAAAYYGIPKELEEAGIKFLTEDIKEVVIKFNKKIKEMN